MLYYGILQNIWLILWWPALVILELVGTFLIMSAMSDLNRPPDEYRRDGNPLGRALFALFLMLATIHLLGVFDVVGWVYGNGQKLLSWAMLYVGAGAVYVLLKGVFRLRQRRAAAIERLRKDKERFDRDAVGEKVDGKTWPEYKATLDYLKPPKASATTNWIVTTWTFWPIDLLFGLFGEYLQAAIRFVARQMQGLVQRIINVIWSNPSDEVM